QRRRGRFGVAVLLFDLRAGLDGCGSELVGIEPEAGEGQETAPGEGEHGHDHDHTEPVHVHTALAAIRCPGPRDGGGGRVLPFLSANDEEGGAPGTLDGLAHPHTAVGLQDGAAVGTGGASDAGHEDATLVSSTANGSADLSA